MRWIVILCGFIAALSGAAVAQPFAEAYRPAEPPVAAPTGVARTATGRALRIADRLEPPAMLVLWAEWCPVCRAELPEIAAAARRAGVGLVLLSVDTREDAEARTAAFLGAHGMADGEALFDDALSLARALGVTGIPHVALIDGTGRVVGRVSGRMDWRDPAFDAYVHEVLAAD